MNLNSANLSSALQSAKSSLASQSKQISTLSRNISGVGDPDYIRRDSSVLTNSFGTTRVETQRYVNQAVYSATVQANGNAVKAGVVATGIDRIASLQDTNSFTFSPAKQIADLQQATEFAAASPTDISALSSLVEEGRAVASSINSSYAELLSMRADADKQVADSVQTVNRILNDLTEVNNNIVIGSQTGREVFDSMDTRDRLIQELSEEIGVKVIPADNNGVVLTTNSGALLFEGQAREVTFQATPAYGPMTVGGELRVDGVVVSGPNANLPLRSGRIAGNLELRDDVIFDQLKQLDEIAQGMANVFNDGAGAELFSYVSGPGIASTISVNAAVDPNAGGDATLLRGAGPTGDATRLLGFSDRFDATQAFDPAAGLPSSTSLIQYTEASLDQLNSRRSFALNDSEYQTQLSVQFSETLQNESGVNLDFEMSRLLEVERAYQASARLLSVIDQMVGTLLEATR